MVTKISIGKSLRAMLHYNENKVIEGEASLILASGFAGDIDQINFNQKLNRFNHLLQLKPNVKTNALHISLNFHSSETLSNFKLQQIAATYMDKIGFGDQPFLVYRHEDAAHSHMHIVTTNITPQGERIDLHDIGRKLSEPARKAIEEDYKLVKAESKDFKQFPVIKKANLEKAKYGRLPTKRAISNVITAVTRDYAFTSLAELNAALKCFNVVALRGEEHTAMFVKKGLMYSILNEDGRPIGVPVKASSLYTKPTLRNLEQQFEKNNRRRKPHKEDLKLRIDRIFQSFRSIAQSRFEVEARKHGIAVMFRQNEQGQVFGVTFVDHKNHCIFNGSDLGKTYSAKGLSERFSAQTRSLGETRTAQPRAAKRMEKQFETSNNRTLRDQPSVNFLEMALAQTKPDYGTGVPKRKKKKKQQQQLTL
ncbi:relaxase/mobilization nuclease domain-containing protein [Pararcticibacter amylolyticus]|uniref:Relaxase n=1 Tax=Pararcticibacter amylolyticus TaxID=2173175 RepID=A0A2U2PHE6_9SPHI|nr:relaxase/mobilization nuclease domain-containing protein [Pararcticibacter amylolyticus]PWG80826.1 relaxase [Pararcticibacter amylolyticus]